MIAIALMILGGLMLTTGLVIFTMIIIEAVKDSKWLKNYTNRKNKS